MYEPPIQIDTKDIQSKFENDVMTVIQEYGISVDKNELVKALNYDRNQYFKGYMDGRLAAESKTEWISVEESLPRHGQLCIVAYAFDSNPEYFFFGSEPYFANGGNGYVDGPHFGNDGVNGRRVIYWMPIPEIPILKGGAEE